MPNEAFIDLLWRAHLGLSLGLAAVLLLRRPWRRFAGAQAAYALWLLPFLQVNFVESNPIPVKAAMAAMGLLEEKYRLPLVPPGNAARDRIMKVLQDLKLLGSAAALRS